MGSLSDDVMGYQRDKWELIEVCRLRITALLEGGRYNRDDIVFSPDDLKLMQPELL